MTSFAIHGYVDDRRESPILTLLGESQESRVTCSQSISCDGRVMTIAASASETTGFSVSEALLETLEVLEDDRLMTMLRHAEDDLRHGRVIDGNELRAGRDVP